MDIATKNDSSIKKAGKCIAGKYIAKQKPQDIYFVLDVDSDSDMYDLIWTQFKIWKFRCWFEGPDTSKGHLSKNQD